MVKCSENPVNAINKKEVTKDFLIYTMGASSRTGSTGGSQYF